MSPRDEPQVRSERGSALIAAAILGGALILSWGIAGSSPRYQLAAAGAAIVRMDNDSGAMIACDMRHCTQIQQPDRARVLGPVTRAIGSAQDSPAEPPKRLP